MGEGGAPLKVGRWEGGAPINYPASQVSERGCPLMGGVACLGCVVGLRVLILPSTFQRYEWGIINLPVQ